MIRFAKNHSGSSLAELLASLVIGVILLFTVATMFLATSRKRVKLELAHAVEGDRREVRMLLEHLLQRSSQGRIWLNNEILNTWGIDPGTETARTHHGSGVALADTGIKGDKTAADIGTVPLSNFASFAVIGTDLTYQTYDVLSPASGDSDFYIFNESDTSGNLLIRSNGGARQLLKPGDFIGIITSSGTMIARVSALSAVGPNKYTLNFSVAGLGTFVVAEQARNIPIPSIPAGSMIYKVAAWVVGPEPVNKTLTLGSLDLESPAFYRSIDFQRYDLSQFDLGTGIHFDPPPVFFTPGKRALRLQVSFEAQSIQTKLMAHFFMAL